MTYYNTNKETGEALEKSREEVRSQEDEIYKLIKEWRIDFAYPEYFKRLFAIFGHTPITSIRRAFSNLAKRGLIEKTDKMVMGNYGKRVHTWRLVRKSNN